MRGLTSGSWSPRIFRLLRLRNSAVGGLKRSPQMCVCICVEMGYISVLPHAIELDLAFVVNSHWEVGAKKKKNPVCGREGSWDLLTTRSFAAWSSLSTATAQARPAFLPTNRLHLLRQANKSLADFVRLPSLFLFKYMLSSSPRPPALLSRSQQVPGRRKKGAAAKSHRAPSGGPFFQALLPEIYPNSTITNTVHYWAASCANFQTSKKVNWTNSILSHGSLFTMPRGWIYARTKPATRWVKWMPGIRVAGRNLPARCPWFWRVGKLPSFWNNLRGVLGLE